jgi:hypothetical protein
MVNRKIVKPEPKGSALFWNPNWKYIPAVKTDILQRFKEMNWTPPSQREGQL